jgi:N-acetylneuraminic acid mutarotase
MSERRYAPAVVALPNGRVLIAGGHNMPSYLKSVELFNSASSTFEKHEGATHELVENRDEAGAVLLPSGKVLIAGGYNGKYLMTAELFNPETNTFEKLPREMKVRRAGPAAVLLPDGKVLIAGGAGEGAAYPMSAELYNPEKQTFEALPAQMSTERYAPAGALLPDGKVLIAGGYNVTSATQYLKSAELFNPATGTFENLPAEMMTERDEAATAVLPNGKVLIAGGYNNPSHSLMSVEVFNPETNAFERLSTELTERRSGPAAALLADGRVLIVGGYDDAIEPFEDRYLKTAELMSLTPTASTAPASNVTLSSATLNGTVLTEASGTAYFQYGTSSAYGASTAHQVMAASISALPVSAAVTGLSPRTTYHFRIVVENASGPGYGADQTFTTAAPPIIAPSPPVVGNASESHRTWREGGKLAVITRRKPPVGTTFSFSLNERASVTLGFSQQAGGRKVRGKCVAQTKANRHKHACKRAVVRGTLTFTGHAGSNKVAFQGRISPSTKLPPGTYTVVISATNALGQRASAKPLTFTIVQ